MPLPKSGLFALLVTLGVGLGATPALVSLLIPTEPQQSPIEWLEQPRPIGKFELAHAEGLFTNRSFENKLTIVLFGFTHCPDVCPTSLANSVSLKQQLHQSSVQQDSERQTIEIVFVSVDPERDSTQRLKEYVTLFDPSLVGVTGSVGMLTKLAEDLGIQFKVIPDDGDYLVAHSATYSIINSEGNLAGRIRQNFNPEQVAFHLEARQKGAKL